MSLMILLKRKLDLCCGNMFSVNIYCRPRQVLKHNVELHKISSLALKNFKKEKSGIVFQTKRNLKGFWIFKIEAKLKTSEVSNISQMLVI